MMKIYTNWAFLRPDNTSLHGDFTIENPSFSMYLLSTQEHTIPLCVKILQILFQLELSWFWIEGNGRFWDFLLFMYHCVVKSSVCTVLLLRYGRNLNGIRSKVIEILIPNIFFQSRWILVWKRKGVLAKCWLHPRRRIC